MDKQIREKNRKKLEKDLENIVYFVCEETIKLLKLSIKEKCVFNFSDKVKSTAEGDFQAECYYGMNPPMVVIYPKVLAMVCGKMIDDQVRKVISHELNHLFVKDDEGTAERKIKDMDYFAK